MPKKVLIQKEEMLKKQLLSITKLFTKMVIFIIQKIISI